MACSRHGQRRHSCGNDGTYFTFIIQKSAQVCVVLCVHLGALSLVTVHVLCLMDDTFTRMQLLLAHAHTPVF